MSGHKPYLRDFKLEAVKLVTDQGLTPHKVARDLGVEPQTLRRWLCELPPASEQLPAAALAQRRLSCLACDAKSSSCARNAIS